MSVKKRERERRKGHKTIRKCQSRGNSLYLAEITQDIHKVIVKEARKKIFLVRKIQMF